MSPKIFRLTPLVAALPFCTAVVHAETLSYFASPDATEPTLSFNTNCAVSDLDLNKPLRKLTCPSGTVPPAPVCSSFGAISASSGMGATPARVLDARRGDTLLFVGSCAKGSGSTSNVPLSYQLLPNDGDTPIATSLSQAQFAITVPATAELGSYVTYRLRAEQAGATSGSLSATYKVVDAPINPPQNCSVSGSPSNSWVTGNSPATFSVSGCTSLTGNVSYRWLVNGSQQSGQTTSSLSSSALSGLATGSHAITARICNDPTQADTGGSSCATPSATASVVAQNVTPTPACSIVPNPSISSAVPSGTNISFSLSCSNINVSGYNTTYAWTRDSTSLGSAPSASSTFTNNGTAEASSAVGVNVCNTPVGGGTPMCQSPAPGVTVRIAAAAPNPNTPSCTNLSGITTTIYHEWDLNTQGNLTLDLIYGNTIATSNSTAIVYAFTTPRDPSSMRGTIKSGGTNQADAEKLLVLAPTACAAWNGSGVIAYAYGNSPIIGWGLGSGTPPVLQPNTKYYITITNRTFDYPNLIPTCTTAVSSSGICQTALYITKP